MLAQSDKENTRRAKVTTPSEREIVIERVFDADNGKSVGPFIEKIDQGMG